MIEVENADFIGTKKLKQLQFIAEAMGMPLDERGYPYRLVPKLDATGGKICQFPVTWNPFDDDGDAFRLAVRFRVQLNKEHYGDDAATRAAIVRRVAATIYNSMTN